MLGHVGPLSAPLGTALFHCRHRAASPRLLPRISRYARLHTEMDRPLEDRLQNYLHSSLLLAYRNCGKWSKCMCDAHCEQNVPNMYTLDHSPRESVLKYGTTWFPFALEVLMIAIYHEPHYSRRLSSHTYLKKLSLTLAVHVTYSASMTVN